jgi:soluble lytic murein transglycosylase
MNGPDVARGKDSLFVKKHRVEDIRKYLLTTEDENIFKQIKKKMIAKNWTAAEALIKNIGSESYRKAIEVLVRLKKFKIVFNMSRKDVVELIEFNSRNSFLKEFELFNRRIEFYYLNNVVKFSDVSNYFNKFKSGDVNVMIKLLRDEETRINEMKNVEPKRLATLRENLNRKIRDIWITSDFSVDDQEIFLNSFIGKIGENGILDRAELLVFKWQLKCLARLLPAIADEEYRALFSSVLKIRDYPESIDEILKDIPKNLQNSEVLLYAKVKYFESDGSTEEISKVLKKLTKKPKYGQFWYSIVVVRTRELIRAKKYREAYDIVNGYADLSVGDRANVLWLSGWLATRFLGKQDAAQKYFQDLYRCATRSTVKAKAAYWLGRTAEEGKKQDDALQWYRTSSKYPLTFYGQLAIYRMNGLLPKDERTEIINIPIPKAPRITNEDMLSLRKNWMLKYALLCYNYEGKKEEANSIFMRLLASTLKTEGEIGGLVRIIEGLGDDQLTFAASVEASRRMVFSIDNLFPVMKYPKKSNGNRALIHAMAKQESGFVKYAESNMRAKGLMQIIPSTAKASCKELNIKYNDYRLKSDVEYNIKIADHYIGQLSKRFRGSKVLVVASYNAGPGFVNKWMEDLGDPRGKDVEDVVDWIESVNNGETREYIQRVLEALLVYETIFSGEK